MGQEGEGIMQSATESLAAHLIHLAASGADHEYEEFSEELATELAKHGKRHNAPNGDVVFAGIDHEGDGWVIVLQHDFLFGPRDVNYLDLV